MAEPVLFSLEGLRVPSIHASAWVAPGAKVIGDVTLGVSVSVWFNCVLRGDDAAIVIGDGTNIQDLTMIHLDSGAPCIIGRNCSVGHGCILHGCKIEDDVLVGMGSTVLNNVVIGRGSVVGAGAVVLEGTEVPPFSLVVGSPAKVKKTYAEDERIKSQLKHAKGYAAKALRFRRSLRPALQQRSLSLVASFRGTAASASAAIIAVGLLCFLRSRKL
ncbi:unnamed protein product [Polarella glacialis]|uniref:Carbonic anhydrase n=1 Tax=Polarella glacialis TaxID=89957 RepID=A0A813GHI1_POLGL|nr:unnamed protein product [Polarella glacialis]CAE8679982.1 unnamed protein product [Polarella glacialis]